MFLNHKILSYTHIIHMHINCIYLKNMIRTKLIRTRKHVINRKQLRFYFLKSTHIT